MNSPLQELLSLDVEFFAIDAFIRDSQSYMETLMPTAGENGRVYDVMNREFSHVP